MGISRRTTVVNGPRPVSPFKAHRDYDQMGDLQLLTACQRRDDKAFNHLCSRHHSLITAMMFRLAPEYLDHSDIRQQVHIHLWKSINRLRSLSAFKSWLHQIVKHVIYDELRRRKSGFQVVSLEEPMLDETGICMRTRDLIDKSPQPFDNLMSSELSDVIARSMSSMPTQFSTAVRLRDIEGLTYEEIAHIMDAELGTVKSRISRGRIKLQELLTPYLSA